MNDRPIRILLVDDDVTILHALRSVLEFAPSLQIVGEAHSGEEALKFVPLLRPDIVLMDAELPVMNGLEATRLIKQHWPQVTVIILAGSQDCEQQAREEGASAYLYKGASLETIVAAIMSSLSA